MSGPLFIVEHDVKRSSGFNLLLILLSVLLTCLSLELVARGVRSIIPARTHYQYRMTRPAPYADAAYFSEAFIAEQFTQPGGYFIPEGTRIVLPQDYEGVYYHIRNHQRVTTGQPSVDANVPTIYIFGGSTVYCSEVPDEFTLPSQIQAQINETFGENAYRVDNYGVSTVTIEQQLDRLRSIEIQSGDIVVFYDGVNEITQAVYNQNPNGWILNDNRDRLANLGPVHRWRVTTYENWHGLIAFIDVFFFPYAPTYPDHLHDASRVPELVEAMHVQYLEAILETHQYTAQRNARFVHILQPHIYTLPLSLRSAYETQLLTNSYIVPLGFEDAFTAGYPALREANIEAGKAGVEVYDLSAILNEMRLRGEEFYLDLYHIDDEGNAVVAEAIFRVLFPEE